MCHICTAHSTMLSQRASHFHSSGLGTGILPESCGQKSRGAAWKHGLVYQQAREPCLSVAVPDQGRACVNARRGRGGGASQVGLQSIGGAPPVVAGACPPLRKVHGRWINLCPTWPPLVMGLDEAIASCPQGVGAESKFCVPDTVYLTGMHWKGRKPPQGLVPAPPPPVQGAQPMPSHCLPEGKCRLQWHL